MSTELNESFVLNTKKDDNVFLEVKIGHMFFDFPDVLFPDILIGKGFFPCSDIRGGAVECKIILYSDTGHETGHVHIIFQPPAKSSYADLR
jgi:5-carboxymethyl-2-hydroxymuconate isomerase